MPDPDRPRPGDAPIGRPPARATAPRSLAEDLRSREDDEVAALLLARPELASPVPADATALAARASTRASTARAMDRLDVVGLQVLEVLAALSAPGHAPPSVADLARACGADVGQVAPVVAVLRATVLVWGSPDALVPLRAVVDLMGPTPAGLGPALGDAAARSPSRVAAVVADLGLPPAGDPVTALRSVAALVGDPARLEHLLSGAPAGARDLLVRLADGPPLGAVEAADRPVRAADATTPVEWLLARGLLEPVGPGAVVLPREVALALRGGRVRDGLEPRPDAATTARAPERVDAQGGGAAAEVVRLVHDVLHALGRSPVPVLRAGGMGVRELRRTAQRLDVEEGRAAFVVELARVAGLLGDDTEADPAWAPTPAYDRWLEGDTAARWAALALPWLATSRVPALVGTRDERGGALTALAPDLDRTAAAPVRAAVLAELAALPAGMAVGPASLDERVRWLLPRRAGAVGGRLALWSVDEAQTLGVVALGALTTAGRALLDGSGDAAAAAVRAVLPAPVDRVLLQADLTAVAPGPLVADVAAEMALVADVESRGGATVYRFSPASVRRALDAGWDRARVDALLAARSATPVPLALERLVDDVARRHGSLRVGAASSYVRSADPATLAEVLADPRAARLGLVVLAPTVAACPAEPATVLAALRAMGLAPAAEGEGGVLTVRAPEHHRAREQDLPRPVTGQPPPLTPVRARALAASLRAAGSSGPRATAPPAPLAPTVPVLGTGAALDVLRGAVDGQHPAWLLVAGSSGRRTTSHVRPLAVEAGAVVVADAATGEVSRVPSHRVVGALLSAPTP